MINLREFKKKNSENHEYVNFKLTLSSLSKA